MKKVWKITLSILVLLIIGSLWFIYTPVDLRPPYLGNKIAEKDFTKGKALVKEIQNAYGGKENWLAHKTGTYLQTADWYEDKLGVANWDTIPQRFQMTAILGTDNAEFTLLNGPNKGQTWGVEDWTSFQKKKGQKIITPHEKYQHKLVYKNYWFQFPFRFSEAPIIAYAGERTVNGETYDLLYATWGSEAANRKYDQYVLYLDKQTKMLEWLNFTVREKANFLNITAQFTDFKTINGITVPFNQYISWGKPGEDGHKLHENRYESIQFGE